MMKTPERGRLDEASDSVRGYSAWLPSKEEQRRAFESLRSLVSAYDESELRPVRDDLRLACANAQTGYFAIASHLPEIWELPKVDAAAIERIPSIIAALLFAERRCAQPANGRGDEENAELADLLMRFWTLLMMAYEELERVARFLGLGHAVPPLRG